MVGFGQHHDGVRLLWSESTRCTECGCAIESDDGGFPPDSIRQHLIASEGRWALHVDTNGPDRLKACKILHCDLDTTLEEVKRMKDRMPGIVYTGTKTEAEWLCCRLNDFGFSASVIAAGDDTSATTMKSVVWEEVVFKFWNSQRIFFTLFGEGVFGAATEVGLNDYSSCGCSVIPGRQHPLRDSCKLVRLFRLAW